MKHSHWRGRSLAFFSAIGIAIGVVASPIHADPPKTPPTPLDPNGLQKKAESTPGFTGKWFVQLASKPTISGGSPQAISSQQKTFGSDVSSRVQVTEKHSRLWNGVVVKTDKAGLEEVVKASNVKAVFPVLSVAMPKNQKSKVLPQMRRAGAMTGVPYAHKELGLTGKGMKIGIIDTGIDIDHPAFGGSGAPGSATFPTSKVVAGYDFVGDRYNADINSDAYDPNAVPDSVPNDCHGHGTHVAGIAAGNDPTSNFRGVAPNALLGAYRVFGCDGSTDTGVMLTAMERASRDGMNVVNMSIGAPYMTWPEYPTAVAADALVNSGVVLTVSQGNEGDHGTFSGSAPAVSSKAVAVGSVDNNGLLLATFTTADGASYTYMPVDGAAVPPTTGSAQLAAYPDGQKTGAVDLPGKPFEGKVALVARGDSTFAEKAAAAQADGAVGVLIYNNEDGVVRASIYPTTDLPVGTISKEQGEKLEGLIARGAGNNPVITWTDKQESIVDPDTATMVSTFSAWGMTADLKLKPDVLAPGGEITSAYPLDKQTAKKGYTELSGTSMAAPHTAGAAALVLESNPSASPDAVKAVLQNTADPVLLSYPIQRGFPSQARIQEPVQHQGAGLIDIPAAVSQANSYAAPGKEKRVSTVTPSKISLGDTDSNNPTDLTITNHSDKEKTYTLGSDLNAAGTYGPNTLLQYAPGLNTKVTFSADKVTVPAHSTRTVKATVTPPSSYSSYATGTAVETKLPYITMYGGYITLKDDAGRLQRIPFAGLNGDYESREAISSKWTYGDLYDSQTLSFVGRRPEDKYNVSPSLVSVSSCPNGRVVASDCADDNAQYAEVTEKDHVYSMKGYDVPRVRLHVETPVKNMKIYVNAVGPDGKKQGQSVPVHQVYDNDGVGADRSFQTFSWDGRIKKGGKLQMADDGRYVMSVVVTKGTGHPQNSKDASERYETPPFVVRSLTDADPTPTDSPTESPNPTPSTAQPSPTPTDSPTTAQPSPTPTDSPKPSPSPTADPGGSTVTTYTDWTADSAQPATPIGKGTPYAGDFTGKGKDGFIVRQGATFTFEGKSFTYGRADDAVLTGDFDGDGKDSVAVVRGNRIYIKNSLAGGDADAILTYGREGDAFLAGDFDGDGKDSVAVVRGNHIYIKNTLTGGDADVDFTYGRKGDAYLVGDWNGDGKDTFAIRRANVYHLRNSLSGGNADATHTFAQPDTAVLTGNWTGSGKHTPATHP